MKHAQVGLKSLENDAEKLRAMSDEVARISRALERLSSDAGVLDITEDSKDAPEKPAPPVALDEVRRVIQTRRLRTKFLPGDLFADPAWDMLLELFKAEIEQSRVSTSRLCVAASVPYTTALRWLNTLTDDRLVVRRDDPIDKRRVFIELAPDTSEAMRRYFVAMAEE